MALIRYLPIEPKANFIRLRTLFYIVSALMVGGSLVLFAVRGLNYGVDFAGGILIEIRTDGPAELADLRDRLGGLGLGEVTLQQFGEPTDVLIHVRRQEGEQGQAAVIETVKEALGETVEYRRTEFVGPKVGDELRRGGIIATLLALGAIAAYIWFRFEWQFSVAALIALAHDVIGTVGFYALTQIEFNLTTLAAVLTVAGYSINDTVVIFDRVREMLRKYKKLPIPELLDKAINSTLSRTILTGGTTLLALIALAAFGGEVIQGFALGLIWGIVIGTYSSFGLAVPLLLYMNIRRSGVAEPKEHDEVAAEAARGGAASNLLSRGKR
jgi:preprotein translocase subunit SecF